MKEETQETRRDRKNIKDRRDRTDGRDRRDKIEEKGYIVKDFLRAFHALKTSYMFNLHRSST